MGSLIMVRHGQASFFTDDYDRLSEVGREQARRLGEYWGRRGLVFDAVYTGPRLRQRQTAELVGASCAHAGSTWPSPIELQELDEFDIGGLLHHVAPALARQDRAFAELLAQYEQSADDATRARNFQRAFEVVTRYWLTADAFAGVETWAAFRQRVERCVRRLQDQPARGRRVAVFTSGGFIGATVRLAAAAPDCMALELSWRIRNCSLSEFVFTRDRLTLDSFNALPHLENPELWTYR